MKRADVETANRTLQSLDALRATLETCRTVNSITIRVAVANNQSIANLNLDKDQGQPFAEAFAAVQNAMIAMVERQVVDAKQTLAALDIENA